MKGTTALMVVEKKKRITLVGYFSIVVIKYPNARQRVLERVCLAYSSKGVLSTMEGES